MEEFALNLFRFPLIHRVTLIPACFIPTEKNKSDAVKTGVDCNHYSADTKVSKEPKYYIEVIAKQMNLSINDTVLVLRSMSAVSPGALLNLLLTVVAKELDKVYDNHISECPDVYCYNSLDSKIFKVPTDHLKKASFKYFAAFRSNNEAVFGIRMANAIRNLIFTDARK